MLNFWTVTSQVKVVAYYTATARHTLYSLFMFNFDSLRPCDAIWRHKSGSTLAQVMACCLTAPSHYLNQCWLIISKVQWHSSECNCTRDTSAPITNISLKMTYLKFHLNLPGANELIILFLISYSNPYSYFLLYLLQTWCSNVHTIIKSMTCL